MTAPTVAYPRADTPCGFRGSVVRESVGGVLACQVDVARCDCGWRDDVFYRAGDSMTRDAAMADLRAHYAGAL